MTLLLGNQTVLVHRRRQQKALCISGCRTPLDSKGEYLSLRGSKAVRHIRTPAQSVLGTGTDENELSTYEASSPRYGDSEEEGPWNINRLGREGQVMVCEVFCNDFEVRV